MEFGVFIQTPVHEYRRRNNPDEEHDSLMRDMEVAIAADRAGFKYLWASEHRFLDEYSHLSANQVVLAYLAVSEDPQKVVEQATSHGLSYHQSNVYRYHDTFPRPPGIPPWPELLPDSTPEALPFAREFGVIIGDPDHALEQCRRWEAAGADQLVFGTGSGSHEGALETIRLMGEHVIPKLDPDPVHKTTKLRDAAAAKLTKG